MGAERAQLNLLLRHARDKILWVDDRATLWRQTFQQFRRYFVTMPEISPTGAIAKDDDAPLTGIRPLRRSMRNRIDKQQHVPGLHVALQRANHSIDRLLFAANHVLFRLRM